MESNSYDDFNISISISDAAGKIFEFGKIKDLYEFFKKENDFWLESQSHTPSQISTYCRAANIFSVIMSTIDSWRPTFSAWGESVTQANITDHVNQHKHQLSQSWIYSKSILSVQLIDCQKHFGGEAADAFVEFSLKQTVSNINNKNGFLGVMYAYELENQSSDILKRRNSEKKSFQKLRDDLEVSKNEIIHEVDECKREITNWKNENSDHWREWNTLIVDDWTDWVNESKLSNNASHAERKDEFILYMQGCKTRIEELESVYQEKLRLEKPAEYWNKAAKRYGKQGSLWALLLLALGVMGIVYFRDFFNSWLIGKEMDIKLNTIQGIALYGSVLATYAFLIRVVSRLAFSSFHLMRDAEEREQLTYVYLSLAKDNNIDESSRSIILQALFSRSETGLLSSESGPTMPGIHEVVKSSLTK